MRFLALAILLLPLAASGASLTTCWDGTRWTTGTCPPQLDIQTTASTSSTVSVTYTLAADAATLYFYVGLPTSGQCVRPAISVIKAGTGAEFFDSFSGADTEIDAGESTVTATGLSADSQYCPYLLATNADGIPPDTLSADAAARYAKATGAPVYTPVVPEGLVKWNPGHYYYPMGTPKHEGNLSAMLTEFTNKVAGQSSIQGVLVRTTWGQLETDTEGNYTRGFAYIDAILAHLAAMSPQKRLLLVLVNDANSTICSNTTLAFSTSNNQSMFIPRYLRQQGLVAVNNRDACVIKFWDATLASKFTAMVEAYGARYDSHPLFEGWVIGSPKETSGLGTVTGYTAAAYFTQMTSIMTAAKAAFPTTNMILATNGGAITVSQWITWQANNGVGQGGPDVAPSCTVADINCSGGFNNISGSTSTLQQSYYYSSTVTKGVSPHIFFVEASELGLNSVGQTGGYSPQALGNFCNGTTVGMTGSSFNLGCTHIAWAANESYGTSAQKWTTGIKPWIDANPAVANSECPSAHVTAGGCLTGDEQ